MPGFVLMVQLGSVMIFMAYVSMGVIGTMQVEIQVPC